MRVNDVMTKDPTSCQLETKIEDIARAMVTCDCGSVPVLDGDRVVGMLTDRDIVIRAVAAGRCPLELTAADVMSHPVVTIHNEDPVETAVKALETNQIRRIPVVDSGARLIGIVSQADLVRISSAPVAGNMIQGISQGIDIGHA